MYRPSEYPPRRAVSKEDVRSRIQWIIDHYSTGHARMYTTDYYQIPTEFQGVDTEIVISINRGVIEISMSSLESIMNHDRMYTPCLGIIIEGYLSADIGIIEPTGDCDLSLSEHRGTYLVNLADSIIYMLGIHSATIEDGSIFYCGEHYVSLPLLRAFQGKNTWYTNFGFVPPSDVWTQVIHYLRTTNALEVFKLIAEDYRDITEELDHLPLPHETIAVYMLRLFHEGHCDDYNDVSGSLMGTRIFEGMGSIAAINASVMNLSKDYSYP